MRRTIHFQDAIVDSDDTKLTNTFDYLLGLAICDPDAPVEVFGVYYRDFLRNKKIFQDKNSWFSIVHYNSRETLYAQAEGKTFETREELEQYEEEYCA